MKTPQKKKTAPRPKIDLIIAGIEGEFIDTEILHYKKWLQAALDAKVVADEAEFRLIWQNELIGIGDKKVYENLRKHASQKGVKLGTWAECQAGIDLFYKNNIGKAKIPEGLADAFAMLRHKGVNVTVVTHAPQELVYIQLRHVGLNTNPRVAFAPQDIVVGERKDENAYFVALRRANHERMEAGLPLLKPENVLVLDASDKYLDKARELGMHAASIENDLPDFLKSKTASEYPVMGWGVLSRLIVEGPVSKPRSPAPKR